MDRLDEIIRDVAYNQEIKKLMIDHFMGKDISQSQNPLRDFVQFQIDECRKNGSTLQNEGFQIGEPWNGDILNAPVLFLSSNPAFNFYEASPRFKLNTTGGYIVMPAHENNPEEIIDTDYIKNFLKHRIQSFPAYCPDNNNGLSIPLTQQWAVNSVPYWDNVKSRIEEILPDSIKNKLGSMVANGEMTQRNYAQKITKYAVCMEIIPFRSNNQFGVNQSSIDYCWENFAKKIITLSGASLIVIVGNNNNQVSPMYVFDTFTQKMLGSNLTQAQNILRNGDIYHRNIGGKDRLIVNVGFFMGKINRFTGNLTNNAINELKSTFAKTI